MWCSYFSIYIDVSNPSAQVEHEATTTRIGEDQIFYCNQRGLDTEEAISLIVNGFVKKFLENYQWNLLLKLRNY